MKMTRRIPEANYYMGFIIQEIPPNPPDKQIYVYPRLDTSSPVGIYFRTSPEAYEWINKQVGTNP